MKNIYRGKLLNLFKKTILLPNGYRASFEMIKHPGAALIIPFISKDKIILLRQLRPVIDSYIYELPAGTLGKGELPLECAKREIIEETGYSAKKFKLLGSIYPVPGYSTERIFIYKASALKKERWAPEEDEIIEHIVVTKPKVIKMFKDGKFNDAKTVCALAMCGWI